MAKDKRNNIAKIYSLDKEQRIIITYALIELSRLDYSVLDNGQANNKLETELNQFIKDAKKLIDDTNNDLDEQHINFITDYNLEKVNAPEENKNTSTNQSIKERIKKAKDSLTNPSAEDKIDKDKVEMAKKFLSDPSIKKKFAYNQLRCLTLANGETHVSSQKLIDMIAPMLNYAKVENSEEMASKLVNHTLSDEDVVYLTERLRKSKDLLTTQLKKDYKEYQDEQIEPNPIIVSINNDILEYVEDKNKEINYPFSARNTTKSEKEKIREPFNKKMKPIFLKMCGSMMLAGKYSNKGFSHIQYENFKNALREGGINEDLYTIFNIDKNAKNAEELCQTAFMEKSKELYYKSVAAILSEKLKFDEEHHNTFSPQIYIEAIHKYMKSLSMGNNDISILCFQTPEEINKKLSPKEEEQLRKQDKDETAEMQIISVHHKFSVSSAYSIYNHNKEFFDAKSNPIDCYSQIVNNLPNYCLVFNQKMHQDIEPKGHVTFSTNIDSSIMAARIDCQKINAVLPKLPKDIADGIKQYVKPNKDGTKDITVKLSLPEIPLFQKIRSLITKVSERAKSYTHILDKHLRVYKY